MIDLAEFLLARIAEDEASASDVHRDLCDWLPNAQGAETGPCDCGVPARLRAECEVKRQIVQAYRDAWEAAKQLAREGRGEEAQAIRYGRVGLETAMAALALPYTDHPEYDPEWRP